jgi:hypothetical protein
MDFLYYILTSAQQFIVPPLDTIPACLLTFIILCAISSGIPEWIVVWSIPSFACFSNAFKKSSTVMLSGFLYFSTPCPYVW